MTFDEWLRSLEEEVIQGEYGYEPGEFNVFPEHWFPLFQRGDTPAEAFRAALDGFADDRRALSTEASAKVDALLELAAELEQAERGSREVSDRVLLAWGWERNCVPGEVNWWTGPGQRQPSTYRPSPTESLDACEAAMPEGWELGFDPIFFDEPQQVKYDAILCRAHWEKWNPVNDDWIERIEARGKTKPLAVCSAICRALAAEQGGDEKG